MCHAERAAGVAQSPIQLQAVVLAIHSIDGPDAGLRAIEASILTTHVEDELTLPGHKYHFDPPPPRPHDEPTHTKACIPAVGTAADRRRLV